MKTQYIFSSHQEKQLRVISDIEKQIEEDSPQFTTISPVSDYESDTRIGLTSMHIPRMSLKRFVTDTIITPLQAISPEHYYYPLDSLHMSIKNIRVVNDPPHFSEKDIRIAKNVFQRVVPNSSTFHVYFYRLLLYKQNLALVGTTDPELDVLMLNLDKELKMNGIEDDKVFSNKQYFFCNMTVARFTAPISEAFKKRVALLSEHISCQPYQVDTISLATCNPVFQRKEIIGEWKLSGTKQRL